MFINVPNLHSIVPPSHRAKVNAVKALAEKNNIDVNVVPIFAVYAVADVTKSDFEWVLDHCKMVAGDEDRLRVAAASVLNEDVVKSIFDNKSDGRDTEILKLTKAKCASIVSAFGAGPEAKADTATDSTAPAPVPVDNSGFGRDDSQAVSGTNTTSETTEPAAPPQTDQPATVVENSEIAAAANSQTPETPATPVDNSGADRNDSQAVSTPVPPQTSGE